MKPRSQMLKELAVFTQDVDARWKLASDINKHLAHIMWADGAHNITDVQKMVPSGYAKERLSGVYSFHHAPLTSKGSNNTTALENWRVVPLDSEAVYGEMHAGLKDPAGTIKSFPYQNNSDYPIDWVFEYEIAEEEGVEKKKLTSINWNVQSTTKVSVSGSYGGAEVAVEQELQLSSGGNVDKEKTKTHTTSERRLLSQTIQIPPHSWACIDLVKSTVKKQQPYSIFGAIEMDVKLNYQDGVGKMSNANSKGHANYKSIAELLSYFIPHKDKLSDQALASVLWLKNPRNRSLEEKGVFDFNSQQVEIVVRGGKLNPKVGFGKVPS